MRLFLWALVACNGGDDTGEQLGEYTTDAEGLTGDISFTVPDGSTSAVIYCGDYGDTTLTSTQRARAIHALGWFPDDTTRAFLVAQARGGNPMFARKAIYALANGWGDQAMDELTVALANPDVQTRMAAANALGHMGTPSAKLALEARLAYETDPTVKATIEKQMEK